MSLTLNVRNDFPEARMQVNGKPLVYLDSAATALKPTPVNEAMNHFYSYEAANIHRGAYYLSDRATEKFEDAREKIRKFIGAKDSSEIIFTKGTTDSINLLASSFGKKFLHPGDEIILSEMEHHSNIVPWQMIAQEKKLKVHFIPVTEQGELDISAFKKLLSSKTKIVSVVHVSNAIGTINPVAEIITAAHQAGAKVHLDTAQSVLICPIDVAQLHCDFMSFSGHKIYGPFGIGILYGRQELLNELPPYQGGGGMIDCVTQEKTTFLTSPQRFEAGTPNIAGAIGLGSAIDYFQTLGFQNIAAHEKQLLQNAEKQLSQVEGLKFIGISDSRTSILSFVMMGCHVSDVGQILDQSGVAIRVGHHCAQPLMRRFNISGTIRASFGVYNNQEDVDIFVTAVKKAKGMLS